MKNKKIHNASTNIVDERMKKKFIVLKQILL